MAEEGIKTASKKLKGLEEEIESATAEYDAIKQELKVLEIPALSVSLEHINAFHSRFSLGEAGNDDQIPFITAVKGTIRDIEVYNGESEGERARLNENVI